MTIEFDEGERAWARNNDQAERNSDITYHQELEQNNKQAMLKELDRMISHFEEEAEDLFGSDI